MFFAVKKEKFLTPLYSHKYKNMENIKSNWRMLNFLFLFVTITLTGFLQIADKQDTSVLTRTLGLIKHFPHFAERTRASDFKEAHKKSHFDFSGE